MEPGKRYWVIWHGPRADGSFHDRRGCYIGPSERNQMNGIVGWEGFELFKFDTDEGRITAIRRERIEQFTTEAAG